MSPMVTELVPRLVPAPLRKRVLDLGVGQAAYTPYVVVGRSRVGSNLLRGLLNDHPQVVAFGEVFRQSASLDWDHTGYFQSASTRALLAHSPLRFLESRLFGRYPASARAVGFKLFYYHAREGEHRHVWTWLRDRADLKVIHLKRRNVLQTHLSRKRAAATDQWVNTTGQAEGPVTIELDYDECLKDFEQTRAWEQECDRFFAARPLLEVHYESLAGDYRAEMARIQAFLGVKVQSVAPSTFQQTRQSLADSIANYVQLKRRFEGTPWQEFFTD